LTLKTYILLASLFTVFAATAQDYSNFEFIEIKGQWDSRIQYKAELTSGAIFVRNGGITILQHNKQDFEKLSEAMHGHLTGTTADQTFILRSHAFMIDFVGTSPEMKLSADKTLPGYNNYFIGDDPTKWESNCRVFQAVTMENVYPNVDVRYYTNNGVLKYDIIVKPGADIRKIALKYQGVDKMQVKNKELSLSTSVGDMRESSPYTYQAGVAGRKEVFCKYVLKDNIVRFDVREYDPTATLIIDPSLVYCSFTGSPVDNWGYAATYGPDGSTFGGGIVYGDGFPTSPGAFQTSWQGGTGSLPTDFPVDIGIMKLSPTGSSRVYATYIGGKGNELPHSLIADAQGNLVIAGRTNSPKAGSPGAYPVMGANGQIGPLGGSGDWDIIVTKLNASGTALIGSVRIGGGSADGANITIANNGINSLHRNYGDAARSEVILDGAGNIYVASCTQSDNFYTSPGAFQNTYGGGFQDGVLLKFNPTVSTLLFSSFLGGRRNDAAYVLSLGPGGDIFVAGGTESDNFPGNHTGTVEPVFNGVIDGFVAQINNSGSTIVRSTYIGTSAIDQIYGIQFDRFGFPYIMGQTTGSWQIRNATYGNPNAKQFIAKLQPDLSAFVYSTAFGTTANVPNISPVAFMVDRCENVYVSGWGGNVGGYQSAGTLGLELTGDAYQSTSDGGDFYFFVMKKNATGILYGSFFGRDGGFPDHVDGGTSRFDRNGVIYQGICAGCGAMGGAFPTSGNAYARTKPSSANCNLALVKMEFNLAGVGAGIQSTINGVPRDSAGCVPLTVDFSDTIANAVSYEWYFNYVPGNPPDTVTLVPKASHTYTTVGTYLVMLVAVDPNTCNVRDSSFIHIRVGDLRATVQWQEFKLLPCDSFSYRFDNLSQAPPIRPFGPQSFVWDFGDGSPLVVTGGGPVFHNFPGQGTYNVTLLLQDTAYCNSPESSSRPVSVAENVIARFTTPAIGCVPYNAVFDNSATIAGQTYLWDFGDGGTSTQSNPTHTYAAAGRYHVVFIVYNPNTCNGSDTTEDYINVFDNPVADFSWGPNPPLVNTPTTFTNNSSPDAVRFKWNFGDGDSLLTSSRLPVQHQYNATGKFNACLTAYNLQDCPDDTCMEVSTLIDPLVDVPNAFTPQSGDINSIVMPKGFGMAKIQFIIWNRWGQKVFETNSRNQGWNGKVKGVLQPMDVYAYTLYVEFFDGTKTTRKGDITLIR
jgi:gliding motility-associated-like protein